MTEGFIQDLKDRKSKSQPTLATIIDLLSERFASPDIELILQTLHRLIDYPSDGLPEFFKASHGLEFSDLINLRDQLETFIRDQVIRPGEVGYLSPLLDSEWGSAIHIFSVNYDPCIELLCRNLQRRLIDGFSPEWNPRTLESEDPSAVYLYKLHGSVLWYRSDDGWHVKIPIRPNSGTSAELELYDGKKAKPIMLYPMAKQPMEAPLLDFAYILKKRLESARFVIAIGYSFRDDYLSALFRDAFNANTDLHMVNIGPDSRRQYLDLISKGPSFKNVFRNRVSCIPFPIERVLKDITEGFPRFAENIQRWQTFQALTLTGRNANYNDEQINALSRSGASALSHEVLCHPRLWSGLTVVTLWSVSIRNYTMALAMQDSQLAEATAERVRAALLHIWKGFTVTAQFPSRWSFMCDVRTPNSVGAAAVWFSFHLFREASRETLAEIQRIRNDSTSPNVVGLIENLRDRIRPCMAFFDALCDQSLTEEAFCNIVIPQMTELTTGFDDWQKKLKLETPDPLKRSEEITTICRRSVLPKVFSDVCDEIDRSNGLLKGLQAKQLF